MLARHDIILNHNLSKQKSIASVGRQHANNSFEGKRIDLVGLEDVLFCWEILEIGQCVEATNVGTVLWDYVVNLISGGTVSVKGLNLGKVLPVDL